MIGAGDQNGVSLWFIGHAKEVTNDYDGPGMNHLALAVDNQATVDEAAAYLTARGVALLFETSRHRLTLLKALIIPITR
jgi:catechol 2,3-dioxygenase-like lactoylglutathione lyase family enzyme